MNILKQIYAAVLFFVLPSCVTQNGCKQSDNTASLEWIDITAKDMSTKGPLFKQLEKKLETIYVSAFKEQETTRMQKDHPEMYEAMIKRGELVENVIKSWWRSDVDHVSMCLAKGVEKVPLAVIKNTKNDILGFALFFPISQEHALTTMPFLKPQWVKENKIKTTSTNEVYVAPLVVRPDCQRCGYGKKLIFSIFSHLPHIKRIYLITFASETWRKTQGFYEHFGFEHTSSYVDGDNCNYRFYEFNRK